MLMKALSCILIALLWSCSNSGFTGSGKSGSSNSKEKTDNPVDKADSDDGGDDQSPDGNDDGNINIDEKEQGSGDDTTDGGEDQAGLADIFIEQGGLKQPKDQCRWSPWFRNIPTDSGQLDSPQKCEAKEYLAGLGYQAYTGAADGMTRIHCCPIPAVDKPVFTKDTCDWQPFQINKEEKICKLGSYVAEVDYHSQVTDHGGDGQARIRCCSASEQFKLKQKECKWSEWFSEKTGSDTHMCTEGSYLAGLGYDRNADGSNGGRMRAYCCQP